mgnify:CR=1 FL=1
MENFSKEKHYIINGRRGQYELTNTDDYHCFFMDDTLEYEYFPVNSEIKEDVSTISIWCNECGENMYIDGGRECDYCRKEFCYDCINEHEKRCKDN